MNIELDEKQREIVDYVAENHPKNVFLWGSSGTGKTLLLAQILSMKISHFVNLGEKRLNVLISSYFSTSQKSKLMEDLQEKYLPHLVGKCEVRFVPFESLCKGMFLVFLLGLHQLSKS